MPCEKIYRHLRWPIRSLSYVKNGSFEFVRCKTMFGKYCCLTIRGNQIERVTVYLSSHEHIDTTCPTGSLVKRVKGILDRARKKSSKSKEESASIVIVC